MMKENNVTSEFVKEIDRQARRVPRFSRDNVFCYWFLQAYVFGTSKQGLDSHVCGGSNDGGFDVIATDDKAEIVHVVQAKHRTKFGKRESAKELLEFVAAARQAFTQEQETRDALFARCNPQVVDLLKQAIRKVDRHDYRLQLYYLTTGSVSPAVERIAQNQVRADLNKATLEVIDCEGVQRIFRDYSEGIAPPIPTVSLEIEGNGASIADRNDRRAKRRCWVFPAAAPSVARLYEECGVRLFAKNVRGYLGGTKINAAMEKTLTKYPDDFYYFNNGITIICSRGEHVSGNKNLFRLWDAQVVNGQQTVRTITAKGRNSPAAVLVKVIEVPRKETSAYEDFISNTVAATNWQNAIKYSDLRSNDARQLELETNLRNLGYLYVRKRQLRSEVTRPGGNSLEQIKKEDVAQAVAACLFDPRVIRSGVEKLFADDDTYKRIFASSDPNYYLAAWWLRRLATRAAKGDPNRGYAKWLVVNFVWHHLSQLLHSPLRLKMFVSEIAEGGKLTTAVSRLLRNAYLGAAKYYQHRNPEGLDISRFYRDRHGHHEHFKVFWKSSKNARRPSFNSALADARRALGVR